MYIYTYFKYIIADTSAYYKYTGMPHFRKRVQDLGFAYLLVCFLFNITIRIFSSKTRALWQFELVNRMTFVVI